MSDQYVNQPQPGATSAEGAYSKDPQQPTHYFHDGSQYGAADAQAPAQASVQSSPSAVGSWFAFTSADYLKGLVLGAGIALVATNPKVQKAVVSGAVKTWSAIQGGVEELKEKVQDAKAELSRQD